MKERTLNTENSQSILKLHKVYIRNLGYKIGKVSSKLEFVNIDRKYAFNLSYETIEDIICITLSAKISTDETDEMLEIGVCGEFSIQNSSDLDFNDKPIISEILTKNAVSILFPYLRTYTSLLSGMTKTSSIEIPVFNINKIFENSPKE